MTWAVLVACGLGALVLARLAWLFCVDVDYALRDTDHHLEDLPHVMADRYAMMTVFALLAALYQDMLVIAVLFAGFAFLGFADAYIYRRARKPIFKHVLAGVAAAVVSALALIANGGA